MSILAEFTSRFSQLSPLPQGSVGAPSRFGHAPAQLHWGCPSRRLPWRSYSPSRECPNCPVMTGTACVATDGAERRLCPLRQLETHATARAREPGVWGPRSASRARYGSYQRSGGLDIHVKGPRSTAAIDGSPWGEKRGKAAVRGRQERGSCSFPDIDSARPRPYPMPISVSVSVPVPVPVPPLGTAAGLVRPSGPPSAATAA